MNKTYVTIIVGAIVVFGLFIYFNNTPSYRNYPPKNPTIIAFGDSLVQGVGAKKGYDFVSLLSIKIDKPIKNLGVSGNTTADGLTRINEAISYEPGTVILLLGGNDYLKKVPEEQTFRNLKEMIFRLQSEGIFVVMLGIRGGLLTDHFESEFKALSKEMHVPYVKNVLLGLLGNDNYMSDAIHPNDIGYAIIADRIYKEVGKYLK